MNNIGEKRLSNKHACTIGVTVAEKMALLSYRMFKDQNFVLGILSEKKLLLGQDAYTRGAVLCEIRQLLW